MALTPPVAMYRSASTAMVSGRLVDAVGASTANAMAPAMLASANTIMLLRLLHLP
jgi:hypothetical protein